MYALISTPWHTSSMVAVALPDLDALDREASVALVIETRREVESHRKQQEEVHAAYVEACAILTGSAKRLNDFVY